MALNRGTNCKFPCTVCLVPKPEMSKGIVCALRTTETMKKVYNTAREADTADESEKYLQSFGLRDIEVCGLLTWLSAYLHYIILIEQNVFWALDNSDPYLALSFDRLHASHLGLFKSHIWFALKSKITAAGRAEIKRVDDL